jgi:hypothetical protein
MAIGSGRSFEPDPIQKIFDPTRFKIFRPDPIKTLILFTKKLHTQKPFFKFWHITLHY